MIRIKNLSKSFGDKQVLQNLSVNFSLGIHGISAPSGVGKTTLLRIICSLETADSGSIDINGKVSVAFQEARLLPWASAESNASFAEREKGLGRKILTELGLQNDLRTTAYLLSGGMQKRVSLARALAADFDILLLDEPFSGLDKKCADNAFEVIRKHTKGKCVLFVTHDADSLKMCDSIFNLT